ncbi:DUF3263 domain-containing protein [Streptomyces smyrnaeus]|uniref:DUF3263 domain-containing protein n=1 Tax=Streptomyces smyrnaeus TaxID=1387713 RepID=UPI0036B13CEC
MSSTEGDPEPVSEPDSERESERESGSESVFERERGSGPGAGRASVGGGAAGLSDEDRAVLSFAARGWPSSGEKERAVREQLGMSPVRYYQYLNALLDDPRASEFDPVTVNRLRRIRQSNRDRTH